MSAAVHNCVIRPAWYINAVTLTLLDQLLDVEYYCDLETWVRGHSRPFKLVPFESLGTVSYSSSIVTVAVSVAVCVVLQCYDTVGWVM